MDHGGCRISTVVDRHALQLIYYSTIKKTVSRLTKRVRRVHDARENTAVNRFEGRRANINDRNGTYRAQMHCITKTTINIGVFCTTHSIGIKPISPRNDHARLRIFQAKGWRSQRSACEKIF